MWLNFSNPTINNLHDASFNPEEYCLVTENYTRDDWVYMIMSMSGKTVEKALKSKTFIEAAHPMHLHGHDFAILAQQNRSYHPDDLTNGVFNYNNPPRRDVALLPANGYVAIGFRTDNPGLWILHCHIAWHASAGLALQIREREPEIQLSPEFIKEKDRICANWNEWYGNKTNWWDPDEFQEDSGV
jgi:hypothetical protein